MFFILRENFNIIFYINQQDPLIKFKFNELKYPDVKELIN